MADETEEEMALLPEVISHQEVLDKVRALYMERSQTYGQVWRQYGALSNLLRAANKIDRLMAVWWHGWNDGEVPEIHKDALDDAFDAMNYLTFFIRSVQEGNITGSTPQRPSELEAKRQLSKGRHPSGRQMHPGSNAPFGMDGFDVT